MTNLEYGVYFGGQNEDDHQFLINISKNENLIAQIEPANNNEGTIFCMAVCKDEVYAAGISDDKHLLLKYNKTSKNFEKLSSYNNDDTKDGQINSMLSYKDKLYIGGFIGTGQLTQYLCVYDPVSGTFTDMSEKTGIPATSTGRAGTVGIATMTIFNDNLYIGGDYVADPDTGVQDLYLAKLDADGSKFTLLTIPEVDGAVQTGACRTMIVDEVNNRIIFGGEVIPGASPQHQYGIISDKDVVTVESTSVDGEIHGSTIYKKEIYFCGYIGQNDGIQGGANAPKHYLAKYNTDNSRQAIDNDTEGALYSMSTYQVESNPEAIYLGGVLLQTGKSLFEAVNIYAGAYDGSKFVTDPLIGTEKAGSIRSVFTYDTSDDDSSNLGLILGLTLGIALPIVLIALYFLYFKFII